jgi:Cys-tRNA(Pro) deacylase
MSSAPDRIAAVAAELGIDIEIKTFPDGTRTAEDAARAVSCDVAQIVKSLVFVADGEPVIAFVSGAHKLDTDKLARAAGAREVRKATADEARDATGFAIGGTPPFGHARALPLFFDESLLAFDEVWCAAGTPRTVFALAPDVLLKATGARAEDLHQSP